MDMQSKAKKLIEMIQTAPVEWKPLGEVADYEQPTKYLVASKNYDDKFDTPVLTAGKTFILGYTDETEGIYKASESPVIIFDDFTTANKWVDFDFKVKSSAMKIITSKNEQDVLLKYVYYWLNTLPNSLTDGDHKRQWISNFSNKEIPIPSLETQKKIVKILDKFTELEATLEAELALRKRQYRYYRDFLLDFDNQIGGGIADGYQCRLKDVVWKTLGEVAEYSKNRICSDKLNEHNYVGVDNLLQNREGKKLSGYVPSEGKMTEYIVNDILIGNIRPYLKKIWQADCTGGTNGDVLVIRVTDEKVNPKYLYQVLADDKFFAFNMKHAKGAKMPRGSKAAIMQYKIPIPPIPEQEKIVAILDKFDTLTHSVSEGLPHEIALRRKQYEYYREQLLAFR
ncbi:restriction endonuclease subunit S [Neisseria lactamica]|uniref:restriction endonuclease subunit S n=1 Tax=Neisseria lactamica TaxID=486 RepID=UPI000E5707A6|nr:restriction endonuclease subunit S [Neisseria lactamica]